MHIMREIYAYYEGDLRHQFNNVLKINEMKNMINLKIMTSNKKFKLSFVYFINVNVKEIKK